MQSCVNATEVEPTTTTPFARIPMSIVVEDLTILESSSPTSDEDDDYASESRVARKRSSRRKSKKSSSKPPAPKPPNPFILYSLENRPRLAEENPDLSNAEVSRLLGSSWRKLHPDEKKKYKKRAAEAKEQQENNTTTNTDHLAPLYMALYEANIGLNSLQ